MQLVLTPKTFLKSLLSLALLIVSASAIGQSITKKDLQTPRVAQLEDSVYHLNNGGWYKKSLATIGNFLKEKEVTHLERFFAFLNYSYIHKRLFDYDKVLIALDSAHYYGKKSSHPDYCKTTYSFEKSLAYFDIQEMDEARRLMLPLENEVEIYLTLDDQAKYFMQLGYLKLLENNLQMASKLLDKAEVLMQMSSPCDLPIVIMKKMEVLYAQGRVQEKVEQENRALALADSCGIMKYKMLIYEVGKNIALKERDFEQFYYYFNKFDSNKVAYGGYLHRFELEEVENRMELKNRDTIIKLKEESNRELQFFIQSLFVLLVLLALIVGVAIYLFAKTRKQKKQAELNNLELKRLDQINKQIYMTIAHDFQEPFMSLGMVVKRIRAEFKEVESAFIEDVENQINQSRSVLQNLMDWSKMELQNKVKDQVGEVEVSPVVDSIINSVAHLSTKKRISITSDIPLNTKTRLSKEALQIAIRNLLINAIKFTPEGGQVQVNVNGSDHFSVSDTGQGLSNQVLEKLFTEKMNPEYGTSYEIGMGMGLYITSMVLKKQGFTIEAKNLKTGGAQFSFYQST